MTDTLTSKLGCTPILSVKVSIKKIKGVAHKNGDFDGTCNGSFTFTKTDLVTDFDSDSKHNGYIILYRNLHIPILAANYRMASKSELGSKSLSGNVNKLLTKPK